MELQHNSNHHSCKRSRAKLGHKDDDDEDSEGKATGVATAVVGASNNGRIIPWQHQFPANRIYRVSRASGGKDRHSKVYTAKGLRDRRVRLSVSTAIQFYDLQDRLGYDQPSKAIEWLLKAADSAINNLPELDCFPKAPYPGVEDQQALVEAEVDANINNFNTKSGCSSTSETSKGSVLSLSRSDSRVKARERARERAAKDKDCEVSNTHHGNNLSVTLSSPASFTELLTGNGNGGSNGAPVTTIAAAVDTSSPNSNSIHKQISTADYFNFSQQNHALSAGFSSQTRQQSLYGNSSSAAPIAMMPFNITTAAPEMQQHQFSFMNNNLNEYNLNFTMSSSGLSNFSRGTLQSNPQPQLPSHHNNQIQRLSSVDGATNLPFYFGAAANVSSISENHFLNSLDGRLQLCYGEGFRHSDIKGKGKR